MFQVCGNLNCCFTPWLQGNFDEGNTDYFEGPSQLGECNNFEFLDASNGTFEDLPMSKLFMVPIIYEVFTIWSQKSAQS